MWLSRIVCFLSGVHALCCPERSLGLPSGLYMLRSIILFLACLWITVSCTEKKTSVVSIDTKLVSGERALDEVSSFVAIGPRVSGTEGAKRAVEYLQERLKGIGLSCGVDEFSEPAGGEELTFRNVTAEIKGAGRGLVVLVSHYDTKPGISDDFSGANDSGSSTGLLIELARVLKQGSGLPYGVLFAFLDGEECRNYYSKEDGLHGSRRLASRLVKQGRARDVRAVIVLDMIGDRDLTVTLPRNCSPELLGMVFDVAREQGVRGNFSLAQGAVLDDHVPFLEAGMPAVDIIDFRFGPPGGGNEYWHTKEDTIDKLSADSLVLVGQVVVGMLNKLADPALPICRAKAVQGRRLLRTR